MKCQHLLFLISYLFIRPCFAEEIDWKKIALETDEPAYGHRVMGITSNSRAEEIGLEEGDFVVQFGEKPVRNFPTKKPKGDHIVFFVRKGGKLEETVCNSSRFGYFFEVISRPWIAYLRGEIGTPSDKLEEDVVDFLIRLKSDSPDELPTRWDAIIEQGYPADELDAVIRAMIAHRLQKPVPVREAFEKVHAEFEVFPHIYFDILENLAMATNQTGVLRELYRLDPDSSVVYEDQIKLWDALGVDSYPPQQNLLKLAEKLRGKEILADLTTPAPKEGKSPPLALTRLRRGNLGPVPPGHYRRYIGDFPKEMENVHLSLTIFPDCTGHHARFASQFKIYLESLQRPERDFRVSPVYARAGIDDGSRTPPVFTVSGGHNNTSRSFNDQTIEIGLLDVTDKKKFTRLREQGSQPQKIDLIRLNGECAVFCNGVCYTHLPASRDQNELRLMFHFSGMTGTVKEINVWELKDE